MKKIINIGIVGCGFVSDYYMRTISKYKKIQVIGAYDKDIIRAKQFSDYYKVPFFYSLDEILETDEIDLVLNLTTPESHFSIAKKVLNAGKHLYSEKPFTLSEIESRELVELSQKMNLLIGVAPCSLLSESVQTIKNQLDKNALGKVRLVYIEMDDGPLHLMSPENWTNKFNIPWPVESEFSHGSNLEHLGYPLSWVIYLFGSVTTCTSDSHNLIPEKVIDGKKYSAPDFSVSILKHESDVVTRLTCGIVGPINRSMTIIGDEGTMYVEDIWDNYSPVRVVKNSKIRLKAERKKYIANNWLGRKIFGLDGFTINRKKGPLFSANNMKMDYLIGVNELAEAILEGKPQQLTSDLILEVNSLTIQINEGQLSYAD